MILLLTTIAGLVVWVVLWALGKNSFDAFLLTTVMILIAATFQLLAPSFSGRRRSDDERRWDPR